MKIIHIGLGQRGRRWLEITHDHAGVTSVGCVDPDLSALDWTKMQFPKLRNSCYLELGEALKNTRADAAIIASPLALRTGHAVTALDAGLAVMIMNPFATRLSEAAKVLEASHRTSRVVMVAQNDRFVRAERTLQQLVREKKMGTVTHVSCIDRRSHPPVAETNDAQVNYSQLLDVAVHHFDSLCNILDATPLSVMARCTKAPWSDYHHGSTTEAILEMERDIHVQYHGSLTSNHSEYSLWIEGDLGVLRLSRSHVWWRKRGWRFFVPIRALTLSRGDAPKKSREDMATLLDQFRAAVLDERMPDSSGDTNVWVASMIEATILSDKTGRVVRVGDLPAAAEIRSLAASVNGNRP
jgi:predicted dehydrogenase